MMPTENFMAFSGTRASGARAAIPTPAMTMTAAAAPMTAIQMLPWLMPNVSTMKTTSRPSRSTPLNASVNAYQSLTPRRERRSAALAASTSRR